MAKKKKKRGFVKYIIIAPIIFFVFLLFSVVSAIQGIVGSEGAKQEIQASNLSSYLSSDSPQQSELASAAEKEYSDRNGSNTKGGDKYLTDTEISIYESNIRAQESSNAAAASRAAASRAAASSTPESSVAETENEASRSKADERPCNRLWDANFIRSMLKNIGYDKLSDILNDSAQLGTRINIFDEFNTPENFIPQTGDIAFFGRDNSAEVVDGGNVDAVHCGIISKVEVAKKGTTIKAMRITVIEGDVDGGVENGNYSHRTSYVNKHTYDLYYAQDNDSAWQQLHNQRGEVYGHLLGYGRCCSDASVTSTDDSNDTSNLYYTIDLEGTYEDVHEKYEESTN